MLKAVFFDLDGTLLPLDDKEFTKGYFSLLCKKLAPYGYNPEELTKVIWSGTKEMVINDGTKTNEEAFWQYFNNYYGENNIKDKGIFDSFYTEEFKQTKVFCKENPYARDIINFIKSHNIKVVLATNPLFPKVGVLTRLSFIGLNESDFDYITTYHNSSFCKPNPKYYTEIMSKLNIQPDEVLMFGNNVLEDAVASKNAGIPKCYMVGEYIINSDNTFCNAKHINMDEIITTIDKEIINYSK